MHLWLTVIASTAKDQAGVLVSVPAAVCVVWVHGPYMGTALERQMGHLGQVVCRGTRGVARCSSLICFHLDLKKVLDLVFPIVAWRICAIGQMQPAFAHGPLLRLTN